ncbi:MAG: phage replisome organizer N-terminal domain-containing protein, partial [Oscillospiraceae bacterium]
SIFRRDINTVRLALTTFKQFGMVDIIDDVITLPNWDKHQNLDAYERRKEQDRSRKKLMREQQKMLIFSKSEDVSADTSADTSADVCTLERDKERDKERDRERDKERDMSDARRPAPRQNAPYEKIMALYNRDCPSLSACKLMSEARKKAIRARMAAGYTTEDFETLFAMAEASTFLKGSNDRDWRADFDWLIKDANMAKVLDGKYGNRQNAHKIEKSGNPFLDMLNAEEDKGDDQDRND